MEMVTGRDNLFCDGQVSRAHCNIRRLADWE
jgi:hypothetical protein